MSTEKFVKKEIKQAIFTYIIVTIFSKIFAFVFGGIIIGITFIVSKIFRLTLTKEEKNAITEKYRKEDEEKEEIQRMLQYEAEIEELRNVKKAHEAEQELKQRLIAFRRSNANN
jgi:ABC-type transport system involved in cytochrome bd biosynthesis fused ATPase/permease subunit